MSTLMIMAGGTGGHVFPALAVADRLRRDGVEVVWLGTRRGLESRVVSAAGLEMEWVAIRGLRGKGILGWLLAPLRMALALAQAVAAILRRRPDALLGMGGFVAGPGGLAAWLLRRPLVIHEANAVAGLTNRYLARLAQRVLAGFPATVGLPPARTEWVGNPVRAEIAAVPEPQVRLEGRSGPLNLLVVGGSQGARVFNERVPAALGELPAGQRPRVRHQCGRGQLAAVEASYANAGAAVDVSEFVDDMAGAYAWADLVLCRAGAMTVAELAASGSAAILVPFPHAAGDHQMANARFLAGQGAAEVIAEAALTPEHLASRLAALAVDRGYLRDMAIRARALALPGATDTVAQICREAMYA